MNGEGVAALSLALVFLMSGCASSTGDELSDAGGNSDTSEPTLEEPEETGGDEPSSSSEPSEPGTEPGEPAEAAPEPPPERELLNEEYTYPRGGVYAPLLGTQILPPMIGSQSTGEFTVPDNAETFEIRMKSHLECPAGYYRGPRVHVVDPAGTSYSLIYMVDASTTVNYNYYCPDLQNAAEDPWQVHRLPMIPGVWTFDTTGECTCSGTVWILTDPRTPVPAE